MPVDGQYLTVVMPEKKALKWILTLVRLAWIPMILAVAGRWAVSFLHILSLSLIAFATVQVGQSTHNGVPLPEVLEAWLSRSQSPVLLSLLVAMASAFVFSLLETFVSWTYTWIHLIINKKITPEVIEASITGKEGFNVDASTAIQRWLLKTDIVYILYESIAATLGNIGTIVIAVIATYEANRVAGDVSIMCLVVWVLVAFPLTLKALRASRRLAQTHEVVGRRIRDGIALTMDLSRPSLQGLWVRQSSPYIASLQRSIAIQGFWKALLPGSLHAIASITPYVAVIAAISTGSGVASFAVILYLTRITGPLASLADILPWFQQNLISVQRLFDVVVKHYQPIDEEIVQVSHPKTLELQHWTVRLDGNKRLTYPNITTSNQLILCIVGPSGSGKTTLLRSLAGVQKIESGELRLDGRIIDPKSSMWRETCGVLPQEPELIPGTIRDNLMGFADWSSTELLDRAVMSLLENIPPRDDCAVGVDNKGVSVGQRRSIALLRCLGGSAGVILLDEPVAGIDDSLVNVLRDVIVNAQQQGRIVILTAHEHDYERLRLEGAAIVRLENEQ